MGTIRICDEAGTELPVGESGTVYFENETMPFEYHGDPEKTRAAQHPEHPNWSALGDVGYVDDEGYLYLTDRKAFMIISGGVNIYPQEVEDVLVVHEAVADCAVFGLPDPEMGEFVQAVVQLAEGVEPSDALAEELRSYLREHIAHYKVPRVIDFRRRAPSHAHRQALQAPPHETNTSPAPAEPSDLTWPQAVTSPPRLQLRPGACLQWWLLGLRRSASAG